MIQRVKDVIEKGGSSLLDKYDGSLFNMICSLYCEHNWKPWRFCATPSGYWESTTNQRRFFDDYAREHSITTSSQWFNVKTFDIVKFG